MSQDLRDHSEHSHKLTQLIERDFLQNKKDFEKEYKNRIPNKIIFTHLWVYGFGWENTIYGTEDFQKIEQLGGSGDECIFICLNHVGGNQILKGKYG